MQGGKTTQNVVIADETGYTKFTLWEEHVGYLQPNKSYHLKNILLRVYSGERYRKAQLQHQIQDINVQLDASTLCTEDASLPKAINDVKIIDIDMLSISDGCLQCGHSIIPPEDEECVECKKCGLLQCREECKTNTSLSKQLM